MVMESKGNVMTKCRYGMPAWIRNRKRTSVESFGNCTVCVKDITHSRGNWVKHI